MLGMLVCSKISVWATLSFTGNSLSVVEAMEVGAVETLLLSQVCGPEFTATQRSVDDTNMIYFDLSLNCVSSA